jgi:hypothetical protein
MLKIVLIVFFKGGFMFKVLTVTILFFVFSFFTNHVYSSILIDPYVGFETGKIKDDTGTYSGKEEGAGFGEKLGLIYNNIIFAMDLNLASLKHKYEDDTTEDNVDIFRIALGPLVGCKFKALPVKIWFVYNFQSAMVFKFSELNSQMEFKGNGMKLGASLTLLPVIDIFAEYFANTYKKGRAKLGELTSEWADLNKEVKYEGVLIGLSIPITLF